MSREGIGAHHSPSAATTTWLTPPHVLKPLGKFDLDPCAAPNQPWRTARVQYTEAQDGLAKKWFGRVWCNPPYGTETGAWLKKMVKHQNGIALIFARTETAMFFDYVWRAADAVLFLEGRLYFHYPNGTRAPANAGGPSALIAYGTNNVLALKQCKLPGYLVNL